MADISDRLPAKQRCNYFFKYHYRGVILFSAPLLFLPVLLFEPAKPMRCVYVMSVMMTFWMTEATRTFITGLIPIMAMPIMGIMSSEETCVSYISNMVLYYALTAMISLTMEYTNLHTRIAVAILATMGYRPRILHLGVMLSTAFISTLVVNIMVTAMICPVVKAILLEFDEQGGPRFYKDMEIIGESDRPHPTKMTKSFFIGVAYSANIGACVNLLGSSANRAFKESYKRRFETDYRFQLKSLDFFCFNVLPAILMLAFTYIWLEIIYMGLFQPKSVAAQAIKIGAEAKTMINRLMRRKLKNLGVISLEELFVILYILLIIAVQIVISGTAYNFSFVEKQWGQLNVPKIKTATPVVGAIFLLFITPGTWYFLLYFWCRKPKENGPEKSLITWHYVQNNLRWDTMLMLGGGRALTKGLQESRLFILIADNIKALTVLPPPVVMFFCSLLGSIFTIFSSNTSTIYMVEPFVYNLAYMIKAQPLYLGLPVAMSINLAFHLPINTPTNAIAADYGNIRMWDMLLAGMGPSILSLIIYPIFGYFVSPFIFKGIDVFPEWAKTNSENLKWY